MTRPRHEHSGQAGAHSAGGGSDTPRDSQMDRITDAIVASYAADGETQRIGRAFLPSRERIVEIVEDIRAVIFPGYFGPQRLTSDSVRNHVEDQLYRLEAKLAEQIYHCLHAEPVEGRTAAQRRGQAAELAVRFLAAIPALRETLALDAQAAYDGDPAAKSIEEVVYCYPGFYAITVNRIAHELLTLGVPLMPRIMTEHAHAVTGCDIHPGATIGRSFFIDHATGVVIGETTRIGDNVKIYQGVTLGALSFPKDERGRAIKGLKRHPTIEDRVTIYANATILGGDTVIGAGATVAGNTFIMESVSADSLVTYEPPKLTVRSKRTK